MSTKQNKAVLRLALLAKDVKDGIYGYDDRLDLGRLVIDCERILKAITDVEKEEDKNHMRIKEPEKDQLSEAIDRVSSAVENFKMPDAVPKEIDKETFVKINRKRMDMITTHNVKANEIQLLVGSNYKHYHNRSVDGLKCIYNPKLKPDNLMLVAMKTEVLQ